MKLYYKILITSMILLIGYFSKGQTTTKMKTLNLKPYSLGNNVCILFKDESFIIFTSTKYLTDFYDKLNDSDNWFMSEKSIFRESIIHNSDTIDFYNYSKEKSNDDLVNLRTAKLIKLNKCLVLNRKSGKTITKITMKPYEDIGTSGNTYYLDNKPIFKTIEFVY